MIETIERLPTSSDTYYNSNEHIEAYLVASDYYEELGLYGHAISLRYTAKITDPWVSYRYCMVNFLKQKGLFSILFWRGGAFGPFIPHIPLEYVSDITGHSYEKDQSSEWDYWKLGVCKELK